MTDFNPKTLLLAAGDWLAIGLFVFIGQLNHDLVDESAFVRFLTTFLVMVLPFTAVALLMGAYRIRDHFRDFLTHSLVTWLVGAPLALLVRAMVNGQETIIVSFMVVTLLLGGVFLLVWRAVFWRFFVSRTFTAETG